MLGIEEDIKQLKEDIDLRNAQIADLQQKILDSDQGKALTSLFLMHLNLYHMPFKILLIKLTLDLKVFKWHKNADYCNFNSLCVSSCELQIKTRPLRMNPFMCIHSFKAAGLYVPG
jgi:hypothetical protein